jgi:adhesin HecA-like repeat protein
MAPYGTVRKIPILITRVDLDVNEGGAIYDVTAVRINDIAFDDRFKFPRCVITINASTLEGAGEQLAKQLNEQILKERDKDKVREVLDEYRIVFDPKVLELASGYIGGRNVQNTRVRAGKPGQENRIDIEVGEAQISNLVSITKLLEDMVRGTKGYEDLATDFWTQYLRRTNDISQREDASSETIEKFIRSDKFEQTIQANPFVDWFKIKTSVRTDYGQFDKINKMHRKIVTYRVIPFKIHVLKFMRPGVFMKSGIAKNNILKRYNYLYTGENTDIQNLRINYKTAYYMKNTVEVSKGPDGVFEKIDTLISKLRGNEDPDNNDLTALRSYPNITKGRSVFNTDIADTGKEARKQDFYDYLTNPTVDMMRIEMEILGDPAYICQDQFIPLNARDQARQRGLQFDRDSGSFNADSHTPLMELIYRLPDDINDKTGVMFEKNSTVPEENLFFAGVYQVVKIDSSMSNGQFLQTLTCVRLNNQNGLGTEASLLASAAGKLTNAFSEEYENNSKRQLDESLKNEARKKIVQGIDKIEDYIK